MRRILVLVGLALAVTAIPALALAPGETVLVNRAANGTHAGPAGGTVDVSEDGRCVAFVSLDPALPGANGKAQVYVRDTVANATTLASVTPGGEGGDDDSTSPDITPDCRFVAFDSEATDLLATPQSQRLAYRRDLQTSTTLIVSRADGASGAVPNAPATTPSMSDDGNRIAFVSTATNLSNADDDSILHNDVYLRRVDTSSTTVVTTYGAAGPDDGFRGAGFYPQLSADGTLVAFDTDADNASADDGAGNHDAFVKNLTTGVVELISRKSGDTGEAANGESVYPRISPDGSRVAYDSTATNLGDPGGRQQVYVRDLGSDATILASHAANGDPGDNQSGGEHKQFSRDGDLLAFHSLAGNLPGSGPSFDVFRTDLDAGTIEMVARAGDGRAATNSLFPGLSGDGEHVAFSSNDGLVADDTDGTQDVYLHHVTAGASPTPTPTATATATASPSATAAPAATAAAPPPAAQPARTIRGDAAFTQGTANDLYLACTKLDLYLIDVLPAGRRVSVTGAADLRLVGRTVDILLDGRKVGSAVIGPDGAFAARVAAPSRRRRPVARYQARVGSTVSQKLRLVRRMVATTLTRAGGNLVLRGVVNPPRARKQPAIEVERFLSCRRREKVKVAKVKPDRAGKFAIRIKVPAGSKAVLYRARTKVPSRPGRPATKGTFTLPRAADVG